MRILTRYILREVSSHAVIGAAIFSVRTLSPATWDAFSHGATIALCGNLMERKLHLKTQHR